MAFSIKSIKTYKSNGTVDIEEYDEAGRLVHAIDALSPTETQEYFFSAESIRDTKQNSSNTLPPDECKFDERGRLIERISYLPNCNEMGGEASSAYVRTLHEYFDHDEHGNWLSVINYVLDAKGVKHIIDTNRREIEYY